MSDSLADLFVSYRSLDDEPSAGAASGPISRVVDNLQADLSRELGRESRVWFDRAPLGRASLDDQSVSGALTKAPAASSCFLVFLSRGYMESRETMQELRAYLSAGPGRRKGLFVVDLWGMDGSPDSLPSELRDRPIRCWAMMSRLGHKEPLQPGSPEYVGAVLELARAIARHVDGKTQSSTRVTARPAPRESSLLVAAEEQLPKLPFPGFRPFNLDESAVFFGRDELVKRLAGALRDRRFVALVGPEECGKTSLVRAGLFQQLAKDGTWAFAELQATRDPSLSLALALAELAGQDRRDGYHEEIQRWLHESGIRRAIRKLAWPRHVENLVLFADQVEHVLRASAADAACQWLERLIDAASALDEGGPKIHVVFTVRSAHIGDFARFGALASRISESILLVPELDAEELQDAIRSPVERLGGTIDDALVQRLANEMQRRHVSLGVLQFALRGLWERALEADPEDVRIDKRVYDGWVNGSVANLPAKVLAEVFFEMNPGCRAQVEMLFRMLYVGRGAGYERVVRSVAELRHALACDLTRLQDLTDRFGESGLAVLRVEPPGTFAETSCVSAMSDMLPDLWPRLDLWLEAERHDRHLLDQLASTDGEGARPKRDLLAGARLRDARSLMRRTASLNWRERFGSAYSDAEAFVRRSWLWLQVKRAGVLVLLLALSVAAMLVLIEQERGRALRPSGYLEELRQQDDAGVLLIDELSTWSQASLDQWMENSRSFLERFSDFGGSEGEADSATERELAARLFALERVLPPIGDGRHMIDGVEAAAFSDRVWNDVLAYPRLSDPGETRSAWLDDRLKDAVRRTVTVHIGVRNALYLLDRSEEDKRAWQEVIARINAQRGVAGSPYADLRSELVRQVGLRPLGSNSAGFEEFLDIRTSTPGGENGIRWVLLPGGVIPSGVVLEDKSPANYDFDGDWLPAGEIDDAGCRVEAVFVSVKELTRAQWRRMSGDDPSSHPESQHYDAEAMPAETIDWDLAMDVLRASNMDLPSCSEWLYAAAGGSYEDRFWWGSQESELDRRAARRETPEPVGASGRDNPFGLYDIYGNVCEWCACGGSRALRATMGGSCKAPSGWLGLRRVYSLHRNNANFYVGIRPVRRFDHLPHR